MAKRAQAAPRLRADGHFALTADWRLEGWCWFPAAPALRPDIDIAVNGVTVASCVASQLIDAVRDSGVGDGRYGFSLSIPAEAANEAVLEARERRTGLILGRVTFGSGADHATAARLDRAARDMAAAQAIVRDPSPRTARIGRALEAFGTDLAARGRLPGSRTGGFALARVEAPALSLVLLAEHWPDTESALRHARPLLPGMEALVVAGNASALACAARAGAVPIRRGGSLAQACNEAVLRARAPVLVLIDAPRDFLATAVPRALDGARFGSGAASELACHDGREPPPARADGIAAVLACADLHAVGGFDRGADGGIDWAGLAAKLGALGRVVKVAPWRPAAPRALADRERCGRSRV